MNGGFSESAPLKPSCGQGQCMALHVASIKALAALKLAANPTKWESAEAFLIWLQRGIGSECQLDLLQDSYFWLAFPCLSACGDNTSSTLQRTLDDRLATLGATFQMVATEEGVHVARETPSEDALVFSPEVISQFAGKATASVKQFLIALSDGRNANPHPRLVVEGSRQLWEDIADAI